MDRISPQRRSWNMSRIRAKDTAPELIVRRELHRRGFRFRLHRRDLPGCPDIVLPKHRQVIFVNGCFWHRHDGCSLAAIPKSNQAFWQEKFQKTVERDKRTRKQLKDAGWSVHVVWECDAVESERLGTVLSSILKR